MRTHGFNDHFRACGQRPSLVLWHVFPDDLALVGFALHGIIEMLVSICVPGGGLVGLPGRAHVSQLYAILASFYW